MGLFDLSPAVQLGKMMNSKEGATSAGNAYNLDDTQKAQLSQAMLAGSDANNPINQKMATDNYATGMVNNDSIQGGLFGGAGTNSILQQTEGQESNLANKGFSLQPEDNEAYGEASGNIARMFGQNDASLSQALSDRGLSNSGVAGAAFTGSQGNKQEQLGQLQMKIAQNRMQMNHERLGQTRNFLAQLGQGAQSAINGKQNQLGDQFGAQQSEADQARKSLGNFQGQANEELSQRQLTAHPNDVITGISGAMALGGTAAKYGTTGGAGMPSGGMSGGGGGMS